MDYLNKLNQIFETSEKIKFCDLYNMQGDLLITVNEESTEACKDSLTRFLQNWDSGKYILELRSDKSATRKLKHIIDTRDASETIVNAYKPTETSEEEINLKIANGVKEALKKQKEEEEKAEFLQEKEELKTATGKIAIVLEQIVMRFIAGKTQLATVQGAPEPIQEQLFTNDETLEQRRYAVSVFIKHIDIDTLVKFAKRIEQDPNIVNTLKAFL